MHAQGHRAPHSWPSRVWRDAPMALGGRSMTSPYFGTPVTSVPYSGTTYLYPLVQGTKWGAPGGVGITLTYSFPTLDGVWSSFYYARSRSMSTASPTVSNSPTSASSPASPPRSMTWPTTAIFSLLWFERRRPARGPANFGPQARQRSR